MNLMNLMTVKTLLSAILMTCVAMGVKIDCEFGMISHSRSSSSVDTYCCTIRDMDVNNDNDIVENNVMEMQHHLGGMTNNDVKGLIIEHQKVINVPDGISQIFPNLEFIRIIHSGVKTISVDDFKGLAKLRELDFSNNEIEELEDGIFTDNELLEMISFKSNEIKIISRNVFKNLEKLHQILLNGNECIDNDWTENFDEMRQQISDQCSSSTDDMEMTISSTKYTQTKLSSAGEHEQKFNLSCKFIEKYWQYSEKDFSTCMIVDDIQNSNYFLSISDDDEIVDYEKIEAFEISTKESKFLPQNLNVFPKLNELCAENTRLESISGMLFNESKFLKRITFSGNEISVIEKYTFSGLVELAELDLSEGEISYIEESAFTGLGALLLLNLAGNKLNYLNSAIFDELSQLQYISLELNHLTYLNKEIFHRNTQLTNIWLNGNKISSLSAILFSYLGKLQLVDLQVS